VELPAGAVPEVVIRAAADPMRSTDAAAAGNRSCSHDFLSFVSGVSAWPARWDGGNDCLAGQPAASAAVQRFFSRNSNILICSFFSSIPMDNWRQRQTRLLC
jgi:hypothetical protein